MTDKPAFNNRFMLFLAYIFAVPAIYLVLIENKENKFVHYHSRQAFMLWVGIFFSWIFFRIVFAWINSMYYALFFVQLNHVINWSMWIYAIWCGIRAGRGEYFEAYFAKRFVSKGV